MTMCDCTPDVILYLLLKIYAKTSYLSRQRAVLQFNQMGLSVGPTSLGL